MDTLSTALGELTHADLLRAASFLAELCRRVGREPKMVEVAFLDGDIHARNQVIAEYEFALNSLLHAAGMPAAQDDECPKKLTNAAVAALRKKET